MLAVTSEPFNHPDYLFEIKWDGYRGMVYLDKKTEIRSRNLLDISAVFPELSNLHQQVEKLPVVLDGEIVVLVDGIPSFSALQSRGRLTDKGKIKKAANKLPAVFVAFDVLEIEGEAVIKESLFKRKEILSAIVNSQNNIIISQYIEEHGQEYYRACTNRSLEGVMAKRIDSPYLPGKRSTYWKKIRRIQSAEFVITGYEPGKGANLLGSLIVGGYKGGELVYQGKVGTGFTNSEQKKLLELLNELQIKKPKLEVPKSEQRNPVWVQPKLVCEVHYTEMTPEGRLRHPSYKGLRNDKEPRDCIV
ncbi:MAG: ATP-dependent DNA ligase [Firmicutes bacterium]|nr:ATP-dependent DNA ligase [Bacillota bacterium]